MEECLPLLNVARLDPRAQSFTLPSCGMIRDIPLKLDMTVFPQAFFFITLFLISDSNNTHKMWNEASTYC